MTVDVKLFLFGLLLLWFPRRWMRRGVALLQRRGRSAGSERITDPWKEREPGDPRVSFTVEFAKFRNYIDLFRAGAGGLMLWGGLGMPAALMLGPAASKTATLQLIALRSGVLLIGLLIQTLRYEKHRISFYPPIFYLSGLSIGLCDARAAGFAFVLIWAVNVAIPNAQAFLTAYAALLVIFGFFFERGLDLSAIYAGGLCFLPVLLSLLAKRPLMVFSIKSKRARVKK